MPKGRCNWKLSVWGVGRGGPGQGSSEPAAQARSDTPALSFCSFVSAQKGDRMQLEQDGFTATARVQRQEHGGEQRTQRPQHNCQLSAILSRLFCAFLCLVSPWHNGNLQAAAAFPSPARSALRRLGELSTGLICA